MTSGVQLRDVTDGDLDALFEHQLDPLANRMAAFTCENPSDRVAFDAHWARIRSDEGVTVQAIVFEGRIAGSVASFPRAGHREVTYWIGREFWGQGIATRALSRFLELAKTRPLRARVAKDNSRSIRVLQKCGFAICGEDEGFSNARGETVEEHVLELR